MSKLIPAIEKRWSPYRFTPQVVEDEKLVRCLDAARWAASSYNDQPWHFIVAKREQEVAFNTAVGCLLEANQGWAKNAGVLMLTVIRTTFQQNNKPNRVALHDLGAAAAHLALQAAEEGLQIHQMAGVNLSQVRLAYSIPGGYEPQTAIAIGYVDTSEAEAGDPLAARDAGDRKRRPLDQFVFAGRWGEGAKLGS